MKIIHKYKNSNKKVQYHCYIYLGPFVPANIKSILKKIQNIDFFNTLETISVKDEKELTKIYGNYWYEKFFISYHILKQKDVIFNNSAKKNKVESKYGKEWFDFHFNKYEIQRKKMLYSYASIVEKYKLLRKRKKKTNKRDEMDFTTNKKAYTQDGGSLAQDLDTDEELSLDEMQELVNDNSENNINKELIENEDDEKENDQDDNAKTIQDEQEQEETDEVIDDDFDLDELTAMYNNVDVESNKNIETTSNLISKALKDKKWEQEKEKETLKFDESNQNNVYEESLKNIFKKYYVYNQYIYQDDTIKIMKYKITCSIKNSSIFGKVNYIIPSRQYLWSEYYLNDNCEIPDSKSCNKKKEDCEQCKVDKVMVGQKWVRRSELLKIDVEPNENLRVYENLRNNLKYLKDSYGSKIKRDEDEFNIVSDYTEYMTANEIYMLDIYHELGINFKTDEQGKKNLYDVFVQIYYPKINYEAFEDVIEYLNGKPKKEDNTINIIYGLIKNDIKLENEIMNNVEKVKLEDSYKYDKLFQPNHVIQSIIHVNLIDDRNITGSTSNKINLFRIFDNFVPSEKYPFLQYQTPDSQLIYKYYTLSSKIEDKEVLTKWFENAPYGISFKIKILEEKYMSINLHDTGRMEYKTTWKEDDHATVSDIIDTYKYVRDLIEVINSQNKRLKIQIPGDDKFKYAFINTIQQFTLPEKFKINHNDLSEFARYFFPYVALVIEPRKRQSKSQQNKSESSKYGTYLRYKRISKYENRTRMHIRILYFMRNYEFIEAELVDEISKQFNVTPEVALEEIEFVKNKYGNAIKKSRKVLKKLKNIPKSKPPGIGIDIQGRDRDKYKIRITGARNKAQLVDIVSFMKVLIFLYVETYLYKKKDRQNLKETLKELTNIAKRRNKVVEIVDYQSPIKNIKVMTALDKKRIGYKPEKGQSQWTRACQNSGTDKKRRPELTMGDNVTNLIKKGYTLNSKTNTYERTVEIMEKGKKETVTLRAVRLEGEGDNALYYTCNPEQNQEHTYVGFLTKGNNPSGFCMPCCFKKDQLLSKNKAKRDYYLKCTGQKQENETFEKKDMGDKLYILQDTNKVQDNRFVFLPKYLDIFFNSMLNKTKTIKNHYLVDSNTGYFFKYTAKANIYFLLSSLSATLEVSIDDIKNKIIDKIESDKKELLFTSLGNGDIRTQFKTRTNYINFIQNNNYLETEIVGDIISIPGVLTKNGVNLIILEKKTRIVKKILEKDKVKEDYVVLCLNIENNSYYYDTNRDNIILIKDDKYYFPIFMVKKDEKKDKKIKVERMFKYDDKADNIVSLLLKYHKLNCDRDILEGISDRSLLIAKDVINILRSIKQSDYEPVKQIVDDRFKCRYILTKNNTILPCKPSGTVFNLSIQDIKDLDYKKLLPYDKIVNNLEKVYNLSKKQLPCKPIGVYFDRKKQNKIHVISIITSDFQSVPINGSEIPEKDIKKKKFIIENKPFNDIIDMEISKLDSYKNDRRIESINSHNFNNEGFQLYRLELSNYLFKNPDVKEKVIKIIEHNKLTTKEKKFALKKLLYKLINKKLYSLLISTQKGGGSFKKYIKMQYGGNFVNLQKNDPEKQNYLITNTRTLCEANTDDKSCVNNPHCSWKGGNCHIALTEAKAIEYTNKVIQELINNNLNAREILQEENYFVSDIANYKNFTSRADQKIIKSSHHNINKIMSELFGKDNVPKIGRRHRPNTDVTMIDQNVDNPLEQFGDMYVQNIIENNNTIYRAYANCYYWIKNSLYNKNYRNLGYVSQLQTDLSNYFKAIVIDWLMDKDNKDKIIQDLINYKYSKINAKDFFNKFLTKMRKNVANTSGFIELYVLSMVFPNVIHVLDNYNQTIFIFQEGLRYYKNDSKLNSKSILDSYLKKEKLNTIINIKFDFITNKIIPSLIYSIYYK